MQSRKVCLVKVKEAGDIYTRRSKSTICKRVARQDVIKYSQNNATHYDIYPISTLQHFSSSITRNTQLYRHISAGALRYTANKLEDIMRQRTIY